MSIRRRWISDQVVNKEDKSCSHAKKILIVSTFIPPTAGGAERVAWQIAMGLKERFEIHILTTGHRFYSEFEQGMMIHYIPYKRPLSFYYSTLGKKYIDKIFSNYNFDLINIHLALPWGYILRKYPVKKVITDHFISFYIDKRNWFFDLIYKCAVKEALPYSSSVTAVSKLIGEKIEKDFGIKVQHIPNGVDLERFYVNNDNEKQNVILFIGRYIELKGIYYLLEVAKKLPMYEFWFAGSGPLGNIIKGENIKNYGYVNKPEELIRKATICIFPSFNETSPLVGLEAMACGKTVIATHSGFSEYIEHEKNGLLIESKSTRAIIESINFLMNNQELRKNLGAKARIKAEQYSWDLVCRQYAELFQKVIDEENIVS